MKESVLDVLLYLFQNYISDDIDPCPDREALQHELIEAGFTAHEVGRALDWLDGLAERRHVALQGAHTGGAVRVFNREEAAKLDVECRGFLLYLEQAGVLTAETRELVIDRVMALESEEIDLDQLKWVILMVLFDHPGQEAAYAWMEELVYDGAPGYIH